MNQITTFVIESETLIIAILTLLGLCYFKTMKTCLVSNCTEVKCLGFSCVKKPFSDDVLMDIIEQPDKPGAPPIIRTSPSPSPSPTLPSRTLNIEHLKTIDEMEEGS